jgi:hypothetical protein
MLRYYAFTMILKSDRYTDFRLRAEVPALSLPKGPLGKPPLGLASYTLGCIVMVRLSL